MSEKIRAESGFILFITLIFLQLYALLAMQSAAWLVDGKHIVNATSSLHKMEAAALVVTEGPCKRELSEAALLVQQPLAWWQQHTCHGKHGANDYYYFQESLIENACNLENKPVRYERNTLLYLQGSDRVLYQSIVTKLNPENIPCQGDPANIKIGLQMRRQLY